MAAYDLSKAAWIDRLAPALSTSLQAASEAITNEPGIQSWLHTASFEAAMGLEMTSDAEAAAMAYGRMLDDLDARFAPLVAAVRELTGGCGRLGLNWRPLSPQFSTLYIDFRRDFKVQVFARLPDLADASVRQALARVTQALPKGEPYPNRPNEATGLLAYDGRCLGVRVHEHHTGSTARRRTVTLLPKEYEPVAGLAEPAAAEAIAAYFRASS